MKYTRKWHAIFVCAIIILACLVRVFLASASWPLPNSDESTMGIMAMHIQQGERPLFFYGQNYMGSLEAYIAAALFYPFGITVFALKLAVVLLFVLFLVSMYFLTHILYGKNLALCSVALLSLGSNAVLSRQLSAIGGYAETLLFAALLFLLASRLALSSESTSGKRMWRLAGFSAWGLVTGLALWSDLLILPIIACSGLILVLFCWRELMRGAIIGIFLCFIVGAFPLIVYNIHAAAGQDSWSLLVEQQTFDNVPHTAKTLGEQITQTLEISLPTITGNPFCHYAEYPQLALLGFEASRAPDASCQVLNWSWSIGYLLLFCISCGLATVSLVRAFRAQRVYSDKGSVIEKQGLKRSSIQLLLLFSALFALIAYIHSNSPLLGPAILARYMICLWIVVPALLWPLQMGTLRVARRHSRDIVTVLVLLRKVVCLGLLAVIVGTFVLGNWITLGEIPQARAHQVQEQRLIGGLMQMGVTRVYSDYWTCDDLAFQSREHILCAVLHGSALLPGQNRYTPYFVAVSHAANAAYLVPDGSGWDIPVETKLLAQGKRYRVLFIGNYTVYQPVP